MLPICRNAWLKRQRFMAERAFGVVIDRHAASRALFHFAPPYVIFMCERNFFEKKFLSRSFQKTLYHFLMTKFDSQFFSQKFLRDS